MVTTMFNWLKRYQFWILVFLLIGVGIVMGGFPVWAQNFGLDELGGNVNLGNQNIIQTVGRVINIFLSILGVVAVALILYGGFIWLTSRGNEEKIAQAKKILSSAVIGLVIIFAAFGIAAFIFKQLETATGVNTGGGGTPCVGPGCLPGGGERGFSVDAVSPTDGASDVKLCEQVQAIFNDLVLTSSVPNNVKVTYRNASNTWVDVTGLGNFTPAVGSPEENKTNAFGYSHPDFEKDTNYHVSISTNVQSATMDSQGNPRNLKPAKDWYFKTGTETDNVAPTVVPPTNPGSGDSEVCLRTPIQAVFSETMSVTSLTKIGNITLTDAGGNNVPLGQVIPGSNFKSFTVYPLTPLAKNVNYTVTLKGGPGGISDSCGNPMANDYTWNFTTGTTEYCTPELTGINKTSGYYGDVVNFIGKNLGINTGSVLFNGLPADSNSFYPATDNIISWNTNAISLRIPVGVPLSYYFTSLNTKIVAQVGVNYSTPQFIDVLSPFIRSLSPTNGPPGQFVTVGGNFFGNSSALPAKVTFMNPVDIGSRAARTFTNAELACGLGSWQDNRIIIKVPAGLPVGAYEVQVTNSDGRLSNTYNFAVDNSAIGPGLCSVAPTCSSLSQVTGGGVSLTLSGVRFGTSRGSSNVQIAGVDAIAGGWSGTWNDQNITPVPVRINLGNGQHNVAVVVPSLPPSNSLTFAVPCSPAPRVVEDTQCKNNFQSPSPAAGTTGVCRNALVAARFSTAMNPVDFTVVGLLGSVTGNIQAWLCNATSTSTICAGATPINFDSLDLVPNNIEPTGFKLRPITNLQANRWYQVTISRSMRALDGTPMDYDYTWQFQTSSDVCNIDSVVVAPSTGYIRSQNETQVYSASAQSANCNLLNPASYSWSPWVSSKAIATLTPGSDPWKVIASVTPPTSTNFPDTNPPITITASAANKIDTADLIMNDVACTSNIDCMACGPGVSTCKAGSCTPVIQNFSPASGAIGTWVAINGCYFGSNKGRVIYDKAGGGKVDGLWPPSAICGNTWTNTQIISEVPDVSSADDAITGLIIIERTDGVQKSTAPANYTVDAVVHPGLCKVEPNYSYETERGTTAATVTLSGNGFGATQDGGQVNYQGSVTTQATNYPSWSNTVIKAITPTTTAVGLNQQISVTKGGVESAKLKFDVRPGSPIGTTEKPRIISLSPNNGIAQTSATTVVTIRGEHFGNSGTVKFGNVSASLADCGYWNDKEIVVVVPPLAANADIEVITSAGSSNARPDSLRPATFTVNNIIRPGICSITPSSGATGTRVIISGRNFTDNRQPPAENSFVSMKCDVNDWPPPSGTNLISNGSFESGLGGSWVYGGGTWNPDSSNPQSGSFSVVATGAGEIRQNVTVVPGKPYYFSGWVKGGTGKIILGATSIDITNWLSNWTEFNSTIIPTSTSLQITLRYNGGPQMNFDNLSLYETSSSCLANLNEGDPIGTAPNRYKLSSSVQVTSWSNKQISIVTPLKVRTGELRVSVDYGALGGNLRASNGVTFTGEPFITSLTPNTGPAGSWITVRGGNFGDTTGQVNFNGVVSAALPAACTKPWTDTEIIVKSPASGTTGLVRVTTATGLVTANNEQMSKTFTYDPNLPLAPGLCQINPTANVNTTSEPLPVSRWLIGDNFGDGAGAQDKINYSSTASPLITSWSSIKPWSNTQIDATVPVDTKTGDVTAQKTANVVVGRTCPLPKIQIGENCIGGWEEVRENRILVSNPKKFTVSSTTAGDIPIVTDLLLNSFIPANKTNNICRNTEVAAEFNQLLSSSSVTADTFLVKGSGSSDQIMEQGSFEEAGLSSWSGFNSAGNSCFPGSYRETSASAYEGDYVYRLSIGCYPFQTKSVSANEDYVVGFWAKGSSGSGQLIVSQTGVSNIFTDSSGRIVNLNFKVTSNWTYYYTSFNTGSNTNIMLGVNRTGLNFSDVYIDSFFLGKLNKVAGQLNVVKNGNLGQIRFQPSSALQPATVYRAAVVAGSAGVKAQAGGLLNCNTSPAGCVTHFITGPDICKIDKVTIDPPSYNFTKVGEIQSFTAAAFASDGQPLSATSYMWTKTDPDTVVGLSSTNTNPINATSANRNGRANLTVTMTGLGGATDIKSASASLDVFLCEEPWELIDTAYNFRLRYCRAKNASDSNILPDLSKAGPNPTPDGQGQEYFLKNPDSPDAIGLRIYPTLLGTISPRVWYMSRPDIIRGNLSDIVVDGYQAGQDGTTVYVSAPNYIPGANPNDNAMKTDMYVMGYNRGAVASTQTIYQELIKNWIFNTNLETLPDAKAQIRNDIKRLVDVIQTIPKALDNYATSHSNSVPSLAAGSYESGHSTSKWYSWQQTLGAAMSYSLPVDPINKFKDCPTGYDSETCWNADVKKFAEPCPAGSHVYQYRALATSRAELSFNAEFKNVTWWKDTGGAIAIPATDECESTKHRINYESPTLNITSVGKGSVVSNETAPKISCGLTCSAAYAVPATVTLTALPRSGARFVGWGGVCSINTGPLCTVEITSGTSTFSALANFAENMYGLSITVSGKGSVESNIPAVPTCTTTANTTCSTPNIPSGTTIALTAVNPTDGSTIFSSWSGACSGTGTCTIMIKDAPLSVTANFVPKRMLSLTVNSLGIVASADGKINCGSGLPASGCSTGYADSSSVVLNATPLDGYMFKDWGGGCATAGTSTTCTIKLTSNVSATANFVRSSYNLKVDRIGTGSGTVSSSPTGINCGSTCSFDYVGDSSVTLQAIPNSDSTFTGWSGSCTGTGTCNVIMNAAKTVTANFSIKGYSLIVVKDGSRAGVAANIVKSNEPAPKINCGLTCAADYVSGTSVVLNATVATTDFFVGWDVNGTPKCGGNSSCTIIVVGPTTVTATFEPRATLTVSTNTPADYSIGTGTVISDVPASDPIKCGSGGSHCIQAYQKSVSTIVKLIVMPDSNSIFMGWLGAPCSGSTSLTCDVIMDQDRIVTAQFAEKVLLNVIKGGNGTGRVTSSPIGIDCGSDCANSYGKSSSNSVTLTATADTSSVFTGWSLVSCGVATTCAVTMDTNTNITANFALARTITVTKKTWDGTTYINTTNHRVTSNPIGMDCNTTSNNCTAKFVAGSNVVLTASASIAGYIFETWENGCTGGATCNITLNSDISVVAKFKALSSFELKIEKAGLGIGTVTSSLSGINCGLDCNANFQQNTNIILTAQVTTGNFAGWSSNCVPLTTTTCQVTMNAAKTVTATFNASMLTVTKSGTGAGTVSSSDNKIDCGSTCSAPYNTNDVVTLTAVPTLGSFEGWSGAVPSTCTIGKPYTCQVTMDIVRAVTATFTSYTLTLGIAGGSGTVDLSTPSANCSSGTCLYVYPATPVTAVTLTANPSLGSAVSWSGCDSSSGNTCQITMSAARTVTATFSTMNYTLNVTTTGSGVVTGPNINCRLSGTGCSDSYPAGTVVTLVPTPDAGANFTDWSGACTNGTGNCVIIMDSSKSAVASFTNIVTTFTLAVNTTGSGTVSSNPAGILNCSVGPCTATYPSGTVVALISTASPNNVLMSWGGSCTGNNPTCSVIMSSSRTVTANFEQGYSLTVTKSGNGTVNGIGISCGSDCYEPFSVGATVTLIALSSTNYTFSSWSGCDSPIGNRCTVSMLASKAVRANFSCTGICNLD